MGATVYVRCEPDTTNRWRVVDRKGLELCPASGKAATTRNAIAYLAENGGGEVIFEQRDGTLSAPTSVSATVSAVKSRSAKKRRSVQETVTSAAAEPATADATEDNIAVVPGSVSVASTLPAWATLARQPREQAKSPQHLDMTDDERSQRTAKLVEKSAEILDKATGRSGGSTAGSPLDAIRDLSVDRVLPPSVSHSKTVKIFNQNVSAAAASIAIVGLVLGGGTFSGIVTPALQSAASKATVGSYLTVGQALFFTVALSVCAGGAMFAARSGWIRNYGGLSVTFLAMVAVIYLTYQAGLSGPTVQAVADATAATSNPAQKVAELFGVFLAYYGPIPFLSGGIAGAFAGNIVYKLAQITD
jgi:hypothetical protein